MISTEKDCYKVILCCWLLERIIFQTNAMCPSVIGKIQWQGFICKLNSAINANMKLGYEMKKPYLQKVPW